ncbi:7-deoxyloganetin glucosyltransferase-like [Euphorbia lathyris]|uniref:7-deoxyloganetin glucosyltransferase-like n=1 Tax=Euphorbia lathyris TaxID=212925 RepID=UPI003313F1DF
MGSSSSPHAVCVPFPAQGHINPMLQLAKLLHQKGFHITFVNTEYNHRRLLKSRGPESMDGRPNFRFETIPDGLPPPSEEAADSTQDVPSLCASTKKNCLAPFRNLLSKLKNSTEVPAVSCIVSDCIMGFTMEASQQLKIPNFLLWTASVCSYVGFLQYRTLIQKGFVPLKDASYLTNGYLETEIDWIRGMEGIPLKALPSFFRTTDLEDVMLSFAMVEVENARNASGVIFNTFDELEDQVLMHLSSIIPNPIYTVGPLQFLIRNQGEENNLNNIRTNLWKEQSSCLKWLDSKQPKSVIYVNFGSITTMTSEQLVEFAWGLANSKKEFLWIIRPDVVNDESAIVPVEFLEEIKERGFLGSWCQQEEVLSHSAIGGFLTHGGWNSTLESLCGDVPMICWPFFSDQMTNSWFCQNKWRMGMEIGGDVNRNEIEKLVNELMNGDGGKEMRKNAMEWKSKAEMATSTPTGSSYMNFEKLISNLLLS